MGNYLVQELTDNYIVINGKQMELTKGQFEQLKIKKESGYVTSENGGYWINFAGEIKETDSSYGIKFNNSDIDFGNAYTTKEFAKQNSLRQKLYNKLDKFSRENNYSDEIWKDDTIMKYSIQYDYYNNTFLVDTFSIYKTQGVVYFTTMGIAQQAINEIVKPFMAEHSEYIW